MSARRINILRSAEIRIFLKVGGIDLTDDQVTRLEPYLVPLRRVEVVVGSVHTEASEFARRGSIILVFDHASKRLAIGSDGDSALRNVERFESPEMAVRVFLSLEDPAHRRRLVRIRSASIIQAFVEGLIAFLALYAALFLRHKEELSKLTEDFGPLWPRAIAFSAIVVTCLLAFGLYNSGQRTQLSGVLARLLLALLVSGGAIAALFYMVPSLQLFRSVAALAVMLAVAGVLALRLVFNRWRGP